MSTAPFETLPSHELTSASFMKALVFRGVNKIAIEDVPIPKPGPGEAVIRVTLTTICGTDLHIVRGEYPVKAGLIIGHEPVGVIHELGIGITGYQVGDRVLVGAITPCGQCNDCLRGNLSQCGGPIGGWRFSNTIHGAQSEYVLVPFAQANLAKIPDDLRDEQVVLLSDIASTGISAAESGDVRIGDAVAVFAQGPIGLCATAGARLKGASLIIGVESDPVRIKMARKMGADVVVNHLEHDVIAEIKRLTGGKGVDVAIEALGTQATFENALRALRPGGTLSSLGVYSGKLSIPLDPFAAGLGDYKIVTTLCPGGKERMRRLMDLVRHGKLDLTPLLTHTFPLDRITEAYELFGNRRDGVIKVAIRP
ncbi:MAG TPA: NAD(P)-dependent alcohol dehydrogenase [Candidatus Acidoferrales bacterium]|jgi:2-desacetyl-2-hydroxyethyl bacteriochlorophyllide A dehydrogenase|nr:NAD(P)-dependent alcohol dehydrogenase [Candidatus Acidoferrales bacterium]